MASWGFDRRARIAQIKVRHGCIDCGLRDPRVLDFDHRDPAAKAFNISRFAGHTWVEILAEIEKCDVRCANCHRIATAERRGVTAEVALTVVGHSSRDAWPMGRTPSASRQQMEMKDRWAPQGS